MLETLFLSKTDMGRHAPSYYEEKYPPRTLPEGAAVTRLGPSPTGFIHLGNLYTAFMNEKLAKESGGIFFLRIEDTDSKREVEGAVESLISSLAYFGVVASEGVMLEGRGGENGEGGGLGGNPTIPGNRDVTNLSGTIIETGDYGPYYQSNRREIYHTYAAELVRRGLAYPCFFTEDEIQNLRTEQEGRKETPGIYGEYAKYRNIGAEEASSRIARGESYVLRMNADAVNACAAERGDGDSYVTVMDGIRGELKMPRNLMDVVILKSDGIPTYHFAHVIDDHLMRTTHVIRGEEWISSLPIHVALFGALGFEPPIYCHSTVLMKIEDGKKRKLSKRKDPELSLEYYRKEGYHPNAILEYLLTIINSNFEEWRAEHADAPIDDFNMTPEKMGVSGILFDLDKLSDVSKDVLARVPAMEIANFMLDWAARHRPDAHAAMASGTVSLPDVLNIGRDSTKPRKDLAYAGQIWDFIQYFYDGFFKITSELPENIAKEDASAILDGYIDGYSHSDDRDEWFAKVRSLAENLGYAAKPKDYKKAPERYKGHVGDVSAVIRIALTGRATSPDIYEIQQILGAEAVKKRIENYKENCIN